MYTRSAERMFQVLEKILRPRTEMDIKYSGALTELRRLEEMVDECYDDDLDPIKGKEDLRQKVSREVAKLIKQCSGDENAWPAYEVATPELLSELDQRWNDAFTGVGNSVGIWNDYAKRRARNKYAKSVARLFAEKRDSYVNSPVTAKQWDAYAARALILLSPLGENKGIWPLPTARTLKQCEDMLARYHVGMKEVSSTLRYLSVADKTIPCYRRICR